MIIDPLSLCTYVYGYKQILNLLAHVFNANQMYVISERYWPLPLVWKCQQCTKVGTLKRKPLNRKVILVTCKGILKILSCDYYTVTLNAAHSIEG